MPSFVEDMCGGVRDPQSLVFCIVFCRPLLVLLFLFYWALYCLSFDLRLLMTSMVSLNFSWVLQWLWGIGDFLHTLIVIHHC